MSPLVLALLACIDTRLKGVPPDEPDTAPAVDTDDAAVEACNGIDDDGDGGVDEGFPDADENGRVDCLDVECDVMAATAAEVVVRASCEAVSPLPDAWTVRRRALLAPSVAPTATSSWTQPTLVRLDDDDGDGVVGASDGADIVYVAAAGDDAWLVAVDGATLSERWTVSGLHPRAQIAAADLDGDGASEILAWSADGVLGAWSASGGAVWTSDVAADPAEDGWHVRVADLDGDGTTEVVADTWVLDGATGAAILAFDVDTETHQHRPATVADLDRDGSQEVLIAGRTYGATGEERWYSGEGVEDGVWSAALQLDGDDAAEVVTLGANLVLSDDDGTTLIRSPTFARNWSGGPCVGDFDGDGASELAYGAYDGFYVRDVDLRNVSYVRIEIPRGQAACAGYDLDVDGALEVLHADAHAFRIVDGRDGTALYTDDATFESFGYWAGPAVGDLDADGDVEIVVANADPFGLAPVLVYDHAGAGWPGVSSVWPTFDYDLWAIEDDGGVPAAPRGAWLEGNGVRTARPNPRYADGPDLTVTLTAVCVADCTYGPVEVAAQVSNLGMTDVPAGVSLVLARVDDGVRTPLRTVTLDAIPRGRALEGVVFALDPDEVGVEGLVAVVDPDDAVRECDATNDAAAWTTGCP